MVQMLLQLLFNCCLIGSHFLRTLVVVMRLKVTLSYTKEMLTVIPEA